MNHATRGLQMRSWSLDKFVEEHGAAAAASVWQRSDQPVSRQTVEQAIAADRQIKIVLIEGFYEVHEAKLLSRIPATRFYFN